MAHSRSNSLSSLSSNDMAAFLHVQHHPMPHPHLHAQDQPAHAFIPANSNIHSRHSSASTNYSLPSTGITSPSDSPPQSGPAAIAAGGLKSVQSRMTHIRARAATSPYPRDMESVHSSSSETDEIAMFLSSQAQPDFHQHQHAHQHMFAQPAHLHQHDPTGQFGRMSMRLDHGLEQLAANVRSATTTSASDRAKQIFVQAWCAQLSCLLSVC